MPTSRTHTAGRAGDAEIEHAERAADTGAYCISAEKLGVTDLRVIPGADETTSNLGRPEPALIVRPRLRRYRINWNAYRDRA
jgi:hypothetical protein